MAEWKLQDDMDAEEISFFHNGRDFDITSIYKEVCELEKSRIDALQKDVAKAYHQAIPWPPVLEFLEGSVR